jgi:CRP-like cAMP-binding protein
MPNLDLFKNFDNPRGFKQGDVLLVEGTSGNEMYAIREGTVEIRVGSQRLAELGAGEFFGEMALIDQQTRSGSIVALTDGVMVPISRDRFMFLVQNHPFFALEVMKTLVDRLRTANRIAAEQAKPA